MNGKTNRAAAILLWLMLVPAAVRSQWTQLETNTGADLWSVHYRTDGVVWIGGFDTVYFGVNGGDVLLKAPTFYPIGTMVPTFGLLEAVYAFSPISGLVTGTMNLGEAETILRTQDLWNGYDIVHDADYGPVDLLRDLYLDDSGIGFAVGANGRLLRTTDNGVSWSPRPTGVINMLNSVARAGATTFLVSSSAGLLRSVDNGITWQLHAEHPGGWGTCVGGTCYLSSGNGFVRSTDAGATWSSPIEFPHAITAFAQLDATTLIVATADGMYRSSTSGQYWERFLLEDYRQIKQIDFHDDQNGICVGADGYAIRTGNAGGPAVPMAWFEGIPPTVCSASTLLLSNKGDPAFSYRWLLNGAQVGTSYDLALPLSTVGTTTLQLIATNAFGSDTSTVQFNAIAPPVVPDFSVTVVSDTICPNTSATLNLTGTLSGLTYRAYANGSYLGAIGGGSGTVTMQTGPLAVSAPIRVVGRRSNSCGVDSLERWVPITVVSVQDVTYTLEEDSLCYPEGIVVHIQNAPPGYWFLLYMSPANNQGTWTPAVNGNLTLSFPEITEYGPYTISVYGRYGQMTCSQIVQSSTPVYSFQHGTQLYMDRGVLVPDEEVHFTFTHSGFTSYEWDFGPGADPPTWSGDDPPGVSYSTEGYRAVTLTKAVGQSHCLETDTVDIVVLPRAPVEEMPPCSQDQVLFNPTISAMHLDKDNSRIMVGKYWNPSPNGTHFFVMKVDSAGQELWRYLLEPPYGIGLESNAYDCTTDADGNIYVSVSFEGSNQYMVQDIHITNQYGILKFDPFGAVQWIMKSSNALFRGLASSPNGLIYATGYARSNEPNIYESTASLIQTNGGGYVLEQGVTSPGKMFVIAFNANGMVVHSDRFGRHRSTTDESRNMDIVVSYWDNITTWPFLNNPLIEVDDSGDVLVSGTMVAWDSTSYYTFGDFTVRNDVQCGSPTDGNQLFLARFSPQLQLEDACTVLSAWAITVRSLSTAADGSIVVTGRLLENLCMNDEAYVYPMRPAHFYAPYYGLIAKFDHSFTGLWHSASQYAEVYDAVANDDGSVFALAGFDDIGGIVDANEDSYGLIGAGNFDRAFVRFSSDGLLMGAECSADTTDDAACWVEKDACGAFHIVSIGGFSSRPRPYEQTWGFTSLPVHVDVRTIGADACQPECAGVNPGLYVPIAIGREAVKVYPTLNSGSFQIEWPLGWRNTASLEIIDATGRVVHTGRVDVDQGTTAIQTLLGAGTYHVRLTDLEGRSGMARIIVAYTDLR